MNTRDIYFAACVRRQTTWSEDGQKAQGSPQGAAVVRQRLQEGASGHQMEGEPLRWRVARKGNRA